MTESTPYLLHHLLQRSSARAPSSEAVRCRGVSLTYEELDRRSSQLARYLIADGVRSGDRVGIYARKGLESAVSIYGVLKAGAAYVPIDPWTPVSRMRWVLEDCRITHLLTDPSKLDVIRELSASDCALKSVIGLSDDAGLPIARGSWQNVSAHPETTVPDVEAVEDDLAYILYTSGSTGQPKGMMHTHRSGLSFVNWGTATYGVTSKDRISNHAPLHFDLSVFDFMAAASAGATTVIIPEEWMKLPASLSRLIEEEGITIWYSVPVALTQLLLRGALPDRDLTSLRWILFGGEPFPVRYLRELMDLLPDVRFSHVYGVTEMNVSHYYHVPAEFPTDVPIPIGRLCTNMEALILNEDDTLTAPGETGELVVRGPAMMRGYWARPVLNREVFYKRKRFEDYIDVFYRTGDLVRLNPDGIYSFAGRRDRQVKVRGHRLELDEIEDVITSHPAVEQAAVIAVADPLGSKEILAAVKLTTSDCDDAQLAAHVRDSLPVYATPRFIFMDELPRTTAGKVDYQALHAAVSADIQQSES